MDKLFKVFPLLLSVSSNQSLISIKDIIWIRAVWIDAVEMHGCLFEKEIITAWSIKEETKQYFFLLDSH